MQRSLNHPSLPAAPLPPPLKPPPSPLPTVTVETHDGCPVWWYWQAYRTWVPYSEADFLLIEEGWSKVKLSNIGSHPSSSGSTEQHEEDTGTVFHHETLEFTDEIGTRENPILIQAGKRQVEFSPYRHLQSGRQLVVGFRHQHREIQRLPLTTEEQRRNPERVLRHMSFARLYSLDRSSGHGSRITTEERQTGQINLEYSMDSMKQTIKTQLEGLSPPQRDYSREEGEGGEEGGEDDNGDYGWILGWESENSAHPMGEGEKS